jgi:hypothetical protein
MLMPPAKGEPAALDEVLDTVRGFLGSHLRQVDDEDRERPEPDDRY